MGILTEEMKRVVTDIQLCYAATVTPDGKPNLSPKGSITVLSDDELGFADLASPAEGTALPADATEYAFEPRVETHPDVTPAQEAVRKSAIWLDRHRASFETAALRPPQDEDFLMPIRTYLMLRSARRARLEARTTSLQPDWPIC